MKTLRQQLIDTRSALDEEIKEAEAWAMQQDDPEALLKDLESPIEINNFMNDDDYWSDYPAIMTFRNLIIALNRIETEIQKQSTKILMGLTP
jgi:hypothetical protein